MADFIKPGTRAMVAAGMRLVKGKWEMQTAPMTCKMCGGNDVYIDHDSAKSRVHICDDCNGCRVITKGQTATQWWYHDWQYQDQMNARFLASSYDRAQSA